MSKVTGTWHPPHCGECKSPAAPRTVLIWNGGSGRDSKMICGDCQDRQWRLRDGKRCENEDGAGI